jgi:hypothetical protein
MPSLEGEMPLLLTDTAYGYLVCRYLRQKVVIRASANAPFSPGEIDGG